MKIVSPKIELLSITPNAEKLIEKAGRVCYKSEDKITKDSASKFIKMLIKRGHESVLEHASATFRFITDRGVTHEEVRHRLSSYSQESTRYCNYKNEVTYIEPTFDLDEEDVEVLDILEKYYQRCIEKKNRTPQEARYFLPTGLKTEIIHTANFRQWRHIFKLRGSPRAHPQIQQIMLKALEVLALFYAPAVFDDIWQEYAQEIATNPELAVVIYNEDTSNR